MNQGLSVVGLKLFILVIIRQQDQCSKAYLKTCNQNIGYIAFLSILCGDGGREARKRERRAYTQLN